MNQNKKVLQFSLSATLCLLFFSVFIHYNNVQFPQLQNISILSNIIKKDTTQVAQKVNTIDLQPTAASAEKKVYKTDTAFSVANRITNFSSDTNAVVLNNFVQKLLALKQTKKGKIRIAYLGDSMIEGDLVSQTLRKYLQVAYGGSGVGFVPVTSAVAGFRTTVKHSFTPNWRESNFKNRISNTPLYLSGKSFFANGYSKVEIEDKTYAYRNVPLKKYMLTGYKPFNAQVLINGAFNAIAAPNSFNKILIDSSFKPNLKFELSDAALPIFGFSFESNDGIIVDNFSFRGIGGFEYINIDSSFLQQINKTQPYDLIIMQFGVNLLNNANNTNFNWYYKAMLSCVKKLQSCFPSTDFLLISSADKGFKYSNGTHTAIGMDSLIATQQHIAQTAGIAFYNTYKSMGGYNSIVNWANASPQLAAKDFTHLNARGAEILGTSIYNSLMYEVEKTGKQ